MSAPNDVTAALVFLDEAAQAAYRGLRELGLSADAAKDAVTVHVSDVLTAHMRDQDGLPTPYGDGDDEGSAP